MPAKETYADTHFYRSYGDRVQVRYSPSRPGLNRTKPIMVWTKDPNWAIVAFEPDVETAVDTAIRCATKLKGRY